ncbi:AMP-binding protein [Paracoccus caeni]|uniref:AMP-binding protein n=1 Tax=Paracoccus caeni TaxID=657651 RepID=A0A934W054_9RHOB|nr:AMP-binding protein [Paracoccus caeni]MBK4215973.1 AMP-binding protein [Paracoccus caeni]
MEFLTSPLVAERHSAPVSARPQGFQSIVDDLARLAVDMAGVEAFRFYPDAALKQAYSRPYVWTWGELHRRAAGVAKELAASGAVRRGDRVLLTYPTGLDFIAALMGCLWLGLVPVPVSPPRPREKFSRWGHVAQDAGVSAILAAETHRDALTGLADELGLGQCLTPAAADPCCDCPDGADLPPPVLPGPEDLAFLQYTSGSTSAPKGVMITHGMLSANLKQIREAFDLRISDRIAGWLPHYHDMGLIGGILTPIHLGMSNTMISPGAFLRDPMRYLELAAEVNATIIGGPNFSFDHCVRYASPEALARIDLSRLRLAFTGAETIRARSLREFHRVFAPCGFKWNHWVGCYGMAEATLCVSVAKPGEGTQILGVDPALMAQGILAEGEGAELAESGAPVDGIEIAIVDAETGQRLASDRIGEIWMRGPAIAQGYWRQPEASAEIFGQVLDDTGGWMRSGDLGVLRDGRLFVTGRLKELIIIRGQNHYPQALEATVAAAHPDIMPGKVAAFPLAGGDDGFGIACELTRQASRAPDAEAIFAAISDALSRDHGLAPDSIALLRPVVLPVTPSGKIQRFACREGLPVLAQYTSGSQSDVVTAPATPPGELARSLLAAPPPLRRAKLLEHLRASLVKVSKNSSQISDDKGFFDMGLDSIGGVSLIAEMEHALGLTLDPTLIYEHTTPAALADYLLDRITDRSIA